MANIAIVLKACPYYISASKQMKKIAIVTIAKALS
jgi:hypothetical protein